MNANERGFTLVEVLVAVAVFAIAVVGLVAMESRSIDAQRSAVHLREAQRIAQQTMADLRARSVLELIEEDFEGRFNPAFPYDDEQVDASDRVRDFRRPPADVTGDPIGTVREKYLVVRSVDMVVDAVAPPSNPPVLGVEESRIEGLALDVTVMWIDDTNPAFPPPAGITTRSLERENLDPDSDTFRPFVQSVQLRTVKANDATLQVAPP